ncbi:MAG: hypothetical protein J3K34DRAFT_23578 [Monoraphidium minutum]|nr:MAG: hypothetical protein J3K34DRAFT_23578 [Monoraphidium minutum]
MASSVTFHYLGPPEQRHVAKMGPMATLRGALADVAPKWRPAVDAATARVLLNKKPVDLDTPFRLLNIPSGSRLDVERGDPAAAKPAAAERRPEAAPAPAAAAAAAAPAPQQQQQQQQPAAAAAAEPSTSGAAAAPAPAGVSPALAALGISVPISVFNQKAVEAAALARSAPAASGPDPDDAFFEFTADDFAEVARAQQRRAAAEGQLLTRALREQQARARAKALGPVPVRLHFPDGSIVQAEFAATQPASAVAALARAVAPAALAGSLYLYTAPPKTVLKEGDMGSSLYDLKLVPAAHVHVGAGPGKLPPGGGGGAWEWLRPEVAALMGDDVPDPLAGRAAAGGCGGGADDAAAARERERAVAEARRAASSAGAGAGEEGGKKLPKWLKR